ncbi:MAG: FAD-dependent oxidoreductase [Proteobacteria bacterium]|nr:FAD-dependent oxidoreductase [Pseudomonadota bacterium]
MQPLLSPSSSITILGAGLLGSLLATSLARQGHRVQVFEAGGPAGVASAAYVAAAMVAPLAESVVAEASIVRMGQHALARWPELIAPLPAPVYWQQNGTLIVWHRQDAGDAARLRGLFEHRQAEVAGLPAMQPLDAAGVAAADPALAGRFAQGLLLPGEGQIDNRQLFAALAQDMQRLGVEQHYHSPREVADFSPGKAGQPDWLIDCRGLGARQQWRGLRGVRGEVVRIHAPEVTLARPTRLIHPRYSIYVAPKENHVFVIGATEIESDDRSGMSVRSALELLSAAYTIHSGFAEGRILELNTQCRPTLPDNLPAMRITQPRVLEINGMYRHGFMQAPALHDVALELMNRGQSPLASQFDLALQGHAFA